MVNNNNVQSNPPSPVATPGVISPTIKSHPWNLSTKSIDSEIPLPQPTSTPNSASLHSSSNSLKNNVILETSIPNPSSPEFFRIIWGNANEFKEGDAAISLASTQSSQRELARSILGKIRVGDVVGEKFVKDEVTDFLEKSIDQTIAQQIQNWNFAELKQFLISKPAVEIKKIMPGLRSEVIAGVIKLMTNQELITVSSKIYNPLPGMTLGAEGYFGSRIQPNSPTDDPEEVLFSVLEGLSYGCGDAILGINIVASDHDNVKRLEETLMDVITTFELLQTTKWCVLAHIDDQGAVNALQPGVVDCGFQSIGGTEAVNKVFNVNITKLVHHLKSLNAQYFETGQGSAVTNKADCGVDMLTLEARAHGLARAMQKQNGNWMIVNTVAGFIGPEVFRTAQQLLRACLEDCCAGKLHGLVFGLDICSTYHMSLEIEEMFQIQEEVLKAGPAFYMALAGNNDAMLSYSSTSYRDHPRLRAKHGKKVTDVMHKFLSQVGVMNPDGSLTDKAGQTDYMYYQYRLRKGDTRGEQVIREEARTILKKLQSRGLDLGYGHDGSYRAPKEVFDRYVSIYNFAKKVIFEGLPESFVNRYASKGDLILKTLSTDRENYILKPYFGEQLHPDSLSQLQTYRQQHASIFDNKSSPSSSSPILFQFVISEGLNQASIAAENHLDPFLSSMTKLLKDTIPNAIISPQNVFVLNGRVRAGYAVGSQLFSTTDSSQNEHRACVMHIIGERPGNGQNTYSIYISCTKRSQWTAGVDHHLVDVVSGASVSALLPEKAAENCLHFVKRRLELDTAGAR